MSTSINPSGGRGGFGTPPGEGRVVGAHHPPPGEGGVGTHYPKIYNMRVYYTHVQAMNIQTHIHTHVYIDTCV